MCLTLQAQCILAVRTEGHCKGLCDCKTIDVETWNLNIVCFVTIEHHLTFLSATTVSAMVTFVLLLFHSKPHRVTERATERNRVYVCVCGRVCLCV